MDSIKEIKEIKKGLKSLLDRLEKVENVISLPPDPFKPLKKPLKPTYPEDDHWTYCVDSDTGEIIEVYYIANNTTDKFLFEHGFYFETKEEAEHYLKERKLLLKLHQWAKIKNEGWEPDWSDFDENKYYIYYLRTERLLKIGNVYSVQDFVKLPYFKSMPIAKECINLFGDEIKEVLV